MTPKGIIGVVVQLHPPSGHGDRRAAHHDSSDDDDESSSGGGGVGQKPEAPAGAARGKEEGASASAGVIMVEIRRGKVSNAHRNPGGMHSPDP